MEKYIRKCGVCGKDFENKELKELYEAQRKFPGLLVIEWNECEKCKSSKKVKSK